MWPVALRNLCRDRRRTLATTMALAVWLLAMLLLLGYMRFFEGALADAVTDRDAHAHCIKLFQAGFAFTGVLVFVIASTIVRHAVAMNVFDRVREIGMLRAMGFSRHAIAGLFVKESLLTTLMAALLAMASGYLVTCAIGYAGLRIQLPWRAEPVTVALDLPLPWALGSVTLVMLGIAAVACATARRRVGAAVRAARGAAPLTRLLSAVAWMLMGTAVTAVQADETSVAHHNATLHAAQGECLAAHPLRATGSPSERSCSVLLI
ncbi:FtsX-like permease family protein [Caldimonas brevitalea]|uniref:ABC3 transporter permease C-terminal domain-containing protein n=1 Tax=Caldimonas brevitalea TaxID=413882 RepID=A0A0G3BK33_9BURK|nr:FtsX-like permease family protein [Caldimonas brevitalea]AKJ26895.1 hypothetical protein AAW51_0204 [Caldimonas brevitalea]